jgi:TAT (twin-arginine translocation) pathway signal sequence
MERRHFLKLAIGVAAAAAAIAGTAEAAPLAPQSLAKDGRLPSANEVATPAVTTEAEVQQLKPEEVRWGHHWHGHHGGWHRHWHRRHWGWRRHHWHRHWHRHHW